MQRLEKKQTHVTCRTPVRACRQDASTAQHPAARRGGESAVAVFQHSLDFAPAGFARDCFALVIEMFALGQRDFDFGAPALEVNAQGDDGVAALAHAPPEAVDLAAMEQEFARASFLVAELAG